MRSAFSVITVLLSLGGWIEDTASQRRAAPDAGRCLRRSQEGGSPLREQLSDGRLWVRKGDIPELAGDQPELLIIAPAQRQRFATHVDHDRLPPPTFVILLSNHQAADRDLRPKRIDDIDHLRS